MVIVGILSYKVCLPPRGKFVSDCLEVDSVPKFHHGRIKLETLKNRVAKSTLPACSFGLAAAAASC